MNVRSIRVMWCYGLIIIDLLVRLDLKVWSVGKAVGVNRDEEF
jgi:hypothetical protein